MTVLLSHIIGKFEHRRNEVLALKVIERLGLTSRQALDEIIAPFVGHMSYNLYELLEYGLVERLSDDVYRIPPLIQRRLGYLLLHKVQDSSLDEMFNQFARKMTIANDNYGTVYASNKLAVGLRSGEEIPELATYLTTAMLFKVGIERYSSEDYTKAHSVLGRAMEKLDQKSAIDVGTQVEIVRYFGLAAARVPNMTHDVRRACAYLEHDLANTPRAKQAKAISAFLKGFDLSRRKDAESAIPEFEESRHLLTGVRNAERQRGAILTELSRAYLLKHPPDYDKAVRAAEEAYREKDTVHNLGGLIRAKTFRLLDNRYTLRPTFDSEVATIRELLKRLDDLCRRTGNDFYLVRLADLERVIVLRDCEDNATSPDLSVPISLTTKALTLSHRHQAREQRWAFCLMDSSDDHSKLLLSETSEVIASPKTFLPTQVSKAVKVKAIVLARTSQGEANEFVARHRSSIHDKTKDYLGKVIRNNGVLSATNQSFIEVSRT
jgi:tetratricopeptide (TPR) repeat protein